MVVIMKQKIKFWKGFYTNTHTQIKILLLSVFPGDPDQRTLVQRDVIRIIQNEVRDMKENLRLYEERADNLTREVTVYLGNARFSCRMWR